MARNRQGSSIQPGDKVYGSDGALIGIVGAATSTYVMVEQGIVFSRSSYFPIDAISSVDDDGVHLTMAKDQALRQGQTVAPSRDPMPVTSVLAAETFTDDDAETITVPVYAEDLVVTKTARQVRGVRIDQRVAVDAMMLVAPVTELRLLVVRRGVQQSLAATNAEVLEEVLVDVPLTAEFPADPEDRFVEEVAIRREIVRRIERVSHPMRWERVTVTDVSDGAVIDEVASEPVEPSSR